MIPVSLLMEQKPIKETCCICGRRKTIAANVHYDLGVSPVGVQPLSAQILIWDLLMFIFLARPHSCIKSRHQSQFEFRHPHLHTSSYTLFEVLPNALQIQPPLTPPPTPSGTSVERSIPATLAASPSMRCPRSDGLWPDEGNAAMLLMTFHYVDQ